MLMALEKTVGCGSVWMISGSLVQEFRSSRNNNTDTKQMGTDGYRLFLLNRLVVFLDCIHFDELLTCIRARLNIIYTLTQKTYVNTKCCSHLAAVVAVVGATVVA